MAGVPARLLTEILLEVPTHSSYCLGRLLSVRLDVSFPAEQGRSGRLPSRFSGSVKGGE